MLAFPATGTSTELPTNSVPVAGESIETVSCAPLDRVAVAGLAAKAIPASMATMPTAVASASTPRRHRRERPRAVERYPDDRAALIVPSFPRRFDATEADSGARRGSPSPRTESGQKGRARRDPGPSTASRSPSCPPTVESPTTGRSVVGTTGRVRLHPPSESVPATFEGGSARIGHCERRPDDLECLGLGRETGEGFDAALLGRKLRVALEEFLERRRRRHDRGEEAQGSWSDVLPGVWRVSGDEDERSRRRQVQSVPELDPHRAFESEDDLIFLVDVERRAFLAGHERLDRGERAVALVAPDLEGEEPAHRVLHRQPFPGPQDQLAHRVILWAAGRRARRIRPG